MGTLWVTVTPASLFTAAPTVCVGELLPTRPGQVFS